MFFDPRRYDLAKVGRYKFNKKLSLKNRIRGQVLAEDVVNPVTGEIIAEADTKVDADLAVEIQDSAVPFVWIKGEERNIKVLSNRMVDLKKYVDCEPRELGIKELVYYPVLEKLMEEYTDAEELKEAIRREASELVPKHITKDDILASINYNMHLEYGLAMPTISTTLATAVSVRWANCFRIIPDRSFPSGKSGAGTHDDTGYGGYLSAVPDQHQTGDGSGKRVFRFFPAVPVHGSEQPTGRADPQETSVRTGTGRSFP